MFIISLFLALLFLFDSHHQSLFRPDNRITISTNTTLFLVGSKTLHSLHTLLFDSHMHLHCIGGISPYQVFSAIAGDPRILGKLLVHYLIIFL